jgi:topoisomerase-4 subunit B
VQDDGRGIPVEMHPLEKVPTVEVVFTRLHAGGKFNKDDGASAYRFSGGLHGVGVSVTNALSTRLEVEVVRDGARHQMAFAGGEVVEPLRGSATRRRSQRHARARLAGPGFLRFADHPAGRSSNVCCAARRCCCPACRSR